MIRPAPDCDTIYSGIARLPVYDGQPVNVLQGTTGGADGFEQHHPLAFHSPHHEQPPPANPPARPGGCEHRRGISMIKYAIVFTVISLVAGALGFGGTAAGTAGIAKVLFGLFLILAVVFVVLAALGVGAVKKITK